MFASLRMYRDRLRDTVDAALAPWCPLYQDLKVSPADLTGKNVIFTGSNVGIGLECARKLAGLNANVTLACRNRAKGERAKMEIVASTGNEKVEVRVLDAASFASVRAFAHEWGAKPVDVLVNNAGMNASHYLKTDDGFEACFQTNFLSQLLLTSLVLPLLRPDARIINVSSVGHYSGTLDPSDVDRSRHVENSLGLKPGDELPGKAWLGLYSDSKLCQVAFTRELQKRLHARDQYAAKRILVASCHPGLVTSSIWDRNLGKSDAGDKFMSRLKGIVGLLGISTEQGACTAVSLATDPKLSPTVDGGLYYTRNMVSAPSLLVEDSALRRDMWTAWEAAAGISLDL